jgi:hypothetical protein
MQQAQWHAMRSFTRDKTVAQQRLSRRIVRRIASNARPCQLKLTVQTIKHPKGLHTFTALPAVGSSTPSLNLPATAAVDTPRPRHQRPGRPPRSHHLPGAMVPLMTRRLARLG